MYNENNNSINYQPRENNFNWKDFFVRAIVVVFFIFLLMWIMPLPTSIKKVNDKVDGLDGTLNALDSKLNILVDRVFFDNLETMKEAAKEYWTIPRLPKNLNEKTTITLREMLDKKLLLRVVDKNGKTCNETSSYVEITRLKDEYMLKTTLVCDDESDYVISYMDLECNLSCNNNCKLKEKEPDPEVITYTIYKHAKTITNVTWTDWSEWTTEVKTADETESKIEYKGKIWESKPVYEYEYIKTTPGNEVCKMVYTYENVCNWVTVPGETLQQWVPEVTRQEPIYGTERQCHDERYVIGTKDVRDCATCEIRVVYIYGTKQVCENVQVITGYKTIVVKPGYYTTWTTDSTREWVCENVGIYNKVCETTNPTTDTIWSKKKSVPGYVATGKSRYVGDEGSYKYTEWVSQLPAGYEKTEERTLYRYKYKKVTTSTEYKWSKSKYLEGWTFTGEFKTVTTK